MALKNFEQDEGKPFGVGYFTTDDDERYYLDHPALAQQFVNSVNRQSNDIALGRGLSQPPPLARAVAGPGGGDGMRDLAFRTGRDDPGEMRDLAFRTGRDDPGEMTPLGARGRGGEDEPNESREPENMSRAPKQLDDTGGILESREPEPDKPQAGQLSPAQLERARQAERGASILGSVPTHRRTAGVDPERMQREGKPVDQAFVRQGALPEEMVTRQRDERAQQYAGTNQVLTSVHEENMIARAAETERLRAEAGALKAENDKRDLELQRKSTAYQTDRAALQQEVDDYYDRSKPSPDGGLRERRGPLGNLASAIAQFMGAYAAIISSSPNFANQILNRKSDRAVEAELEAFKRGKMKRDSQIARMAERGMSIEQMRSALKLQQELYIKKEGELRVQQEGTRESKAAFQTMMAGRADRFRALEQEFEKESLGKESVSGAFVQPKAGGAVPLTYEERLRIAVERTKLGNELGDELAGGKTARDERWRAEDRADKQAEREDKRDTERNKVTEDQAKAEAAWDTVEAYGDAVGIRKDPKTGERVADQGLFSRDTLIAPGRRESVNDLTGQGKPIEAARMAAIEGLGRLQSGGVISPSEAENFTRLLGDGGATRAQIATNLNALRVLIQKRRNTANQQKPTGAPSSWQSR